MIKYFCDRCGNEYNTNQFQAELKIIRDSNILIPLDKKQQQVARQRTIDIYHLCPECANAFEKSCLNRKDGISNK